MIFVRKRFITQDGLREVIAVLPEGEQDSMEKSPLITIVSEKTGEDAARELLQRFDLTRLIETEKLIVYFPQCRDGLWEISESASLSPDEKFLQALPMQGIHTLFKMLNSVMKNCRSFTKKQGEPENALTCRTCYDIFLSRRCVTFHLNAGVSRFRLSNGKKGRDT